MIELVQADRTPAELSREFGCSTRNKGKPLLGKEGLSSFEREELARRLRENRELKMERDILAKAMA